MPIALAPLLTVLLSLSATIASAVMPILVAAFVKRLRIANAATLTNQLQSIATTAGGIAYQALAASAEQPRSITIKSQAITQGVAHILSIAPHIVGALGLDQPQLASMVTGELGKLLAQDPTLAAGPSATVSTSGMPG
jgi:hypothetical protein